MGRFDSDFILRGLGTALVTPFRDGEVDYRAFGALVDRQVLAGVDFLVPLGSTGETPCLEDDEKVALTEYAAARSGGRPVMVGVGTNSLKHTVRNMRLLEDRGADIFLVVVPYYNKPTQKGMVEYFKAVAAETDKPVVLYNVPSRTGVNMRSCTALELAEVDNIIAIKEASGDMSQIRAILADAPKGFTVLSGNDDQTLAVMQYGGAGVISVASNIAPRQMAELVAAAASGDLDRAKALDEKLTPLFKACFIESNPIPVKAGLASMGLICNELRLPLTACETETYKTMREVVAALEQPV